METWFIFKDGIGSVSFTSGYGTAEEAERFCDRLNKNRTQNLIFAEEVTDPQELVKLDAGNGDFNLSEELSNKDNEIEIVSN
jgi:hypothetical protein